MSPAIKKTEIVLKLYARLKQSPCTISILEDWKRKNGYTFSNRSLYRYMDELSSSLVVRGEEIEVIAGEHNKKTWKLVYKESGTNFSLSDIHTFYLTKVFIPNDILKQRGKSFEKLEAYIYKAGSKDKFEFASDAFNLKLKNSNFYEARYTKAQQQTIDQLIWAIQNKRKLHVESLSNHVDTVFNNINAGDIICPLSLQNHRGVLHLCAYNETIKKVVIIAFDTLAYFTATNDIFNPAKHVAQLQQFFNAHFGISPNINNKIYKIELEFAGSTGGFVSQFFWHNTQKFTTLKNGNTHLTLTCGINRELAGWIFQWMNNVRVIKPALLKKMVVDLHQQCIDANNTKTFTYRNHFLQKDV